LLDLLGRITGFEIAHLTIEQRRRYGCVTLGGEAVGDSFDMMVDAENLLDDDHAPPRRAAGIGPIGAKTMPVGCGEVQHFAQNVPPCWLHIGGSASAPPGNTAADQVCLSTLFQEREQAPRPRE